MNKAALSPLKFLRPMGKAIGRVTVNNPNKAIKWTSRIGAPLLTGGIGFGGIGYYQGRGQANQTMQGVGRDAAEAAAATQLQNMPFWQKEMVAMDPSLAMIYGDKARPGLIKNFEKQTGQAFKPGMIGSLYNQIQSKPTSFVYSNPATGGNSYI